MKDVLYYEYKQSVYELRQWTFEPLLKKTSSWYLNCYIGFGMLE